MRTQVRSKLAAEIRDWAHLGLIPDALADQLAQPFETPADRARLLRKWLGFFALYFLGMGVLSLLALTDSNLGLNAVLYGTAAVLLWIYGGRKAADPAQQHPYAGAVMLTVGLVLGYAALSLLYLAAGGSMYSDVFPFFMLLTSAAALASAYQYRLRWPLLLGVVLVFHALGSWHRYGGHGAYFLDVQEPRIMALAGVAVMLLGLWHETVLEADRLRRHVGFGHVYLIAGLIYLNLSLWLQSLFPGGFDWVLVFTAACIGQLVLGARLHDNRIYGFAIVFLGIDLYTRFFEHFWDRLSASMFFMVAGALGIAIGYACERHAAQLKTNADATRVPA